MKMNTKNPFQTEEQNRIFRKYKEISSLRAECIQKMSQLRNDFCETLPFKVGEHVIIRYGFDVYEGLIKRIEVDELFSFMDIYISPLQKDGTPLQMEDKVLILLWELAKIPIANNDTQLTLTAISQQ